MQSLRLQRCLEAGHKQRCPDSLAGDVTNCDSPSPSLQGEKIIVVSANTLSRLIGCFARKSRNRKTLLGEKGLLHVLRELQILAQGPMNTRIGFLKKLQDRFYMIV